VAWLALPGGLFRPAPGTQWSPASGLFSPITAPGIVMFRSQPTGAMMSA